MTPTEQKRYLQSRGLAPPDEEGEGLMPFPEDPAKSDPGLGDVAKAFGRGYAKEYGVDVPEQRVISGTGMPASEAAAVAESPQEKLKKLMTPEYMQRLRDRAGVNGTPR